jgi:hypothetical protein
MQFVGARRHLYNEHNRMKSVRPLDCLDRTPFVPINCTTHLSAWIAAPQIESAPRNHGDAIDADSLPRRMNESGTASGGV